MGAISRPLVSVEEYLSTSYEPDCDYVDGELEERNVGEKDHAKLQRDLLIYLHEHRKQGGIFVIQEQRVQISPRRFRVPDLCVYVGPEPDEQIFTSPPFLCIEILSPEDRMNRAQRKIDDYLAFGVRYVWVVDPLVRKGWIYTSEVMREAKDGLLQTENPDITVPLGDIFAEWGGLTR
jgi:Uma2 family endonuclease